MSGPPVHQQLELDVDHVVDEAPAGDDFGAWLRSLPPTPWRDEERDE